MGVLRDLSVIPVVVLWNFGGTSPGFRLGFYGISSDRFLVFFCGYSGMSMVFHLAFYDTTLGFLLDSCGISMISMG